MEQNPVTMSLLLLVALLLWVLVTVLVLAVCASAAERRPAATGDVAPRARRFAPAARSLATKLSSGPEPLT